MQTHRHTCSYENGAVAIFQRATASMIRGNKKKGWGGRSGKSIAIKAGRYKQRQIKQRGRGSGGHNRWDTSRCCRSGGRGARAENKNSANKEGCQGMRSSQRASGSSGSLGSAGSRSAGGIAAVYLTRPTEIPFHLGVRRRASLSNDATPVALPLFLSLSPHTYIYRIYIYIYTYIYRIYIYSFPCCGISPRHASSRVDSYLCRSRRATYPRLHRTATRRDKLWRTREHHRYSSSLSLSLSSSYSTLLIRRPECRHVACGFRVPQPFPLGHRSTSIRRRTVSSECELRAAPSPPDAVSR